MARITVEDCLKKENNRFALVLLASRRAKQLLTGSQPLTDSEGNKSIVTALREIADSKVSFMTQEEADREDAEERRRIEEEAELRSSNSRIDEAVASAVAAAPPMPMMPNGNGSASDSDSEHDS